MRKVIKDKNNIEIRVNKKEGNMLTGLLDSFLVRLNKGLLQHPLQLNELYMLGIILNYAEKYHIKSCIDLGCGSSPYGNFLGNRGIKYLGCDLDKTAFKIASSKYTSKNTKYLNINIFNAIKYIKKYDAILLMDVIEHFDTMYTGCQFFEKVCNAAKKGAFIFVSTPMRQANVPNSPESHLYEFSRSEFYNIVDKNNLTCVLEIGCNVPEKYLDKDYFKFKDVYGETVIRSIFSSMYPELSKNNFFVLIKP